MKTWLYPAISVARAFENNRSAACLGIGATHKVKGDIIMLCAYNEFEGVGQSSIHQCINAIRRFENFPANLIESIRLSKQKADCYGIDEDKVMQDLLYSLALKKQPEYVFGKYIGENGQISLQIPDSIEPERLKSSQQKALELLDDKKLLIQCPIESVALGLRKAITQDSIPTAIALAIGLLVAGIEQNKYSFVEW